MKSPSSPHNLFLSRGESDLDDDALLGRIKLDDAAAYRILVERHLDRAFALARRILSNASDAEDATQEAFLKVWTHRDSWQPGRAKFSTWLYRVVFNCCIDITRVPRGMCLDDVVPEPTDEKPIAEDVLHRREVYDKLERALRTLPVSQRAAVLSAYYYAMSNAEIAIVLDTTVQAAASLLKRGRQRLRTSLRRSAVDVREVFAAE